MNILHSFVTEKYTDKETGEEKTFFTRIGTTVPHRKGGGSTLLVRKGISISGQVVSFPPKESPAEGDAPIEGELMERQG